MTSAHPPLAVSHTDGTLTTTVAAPPRQFDGYGLLSLYLPSSLAQAWTAGRYLLARCGAQTEDERLEQWHIYFRRPLFVASIGLLSTPSQSAPHPPSAAGESAPFAIGELHFPLGANPPDPGYAWLTRLEKQEPINVIGLLGNGFRLEESTHNLLLTAPAERMAALLPLVEPVLDRGGRVTVLVRSERPPTELNARLPLAVEVHTAADEAEWTAALQELLPWADQLCAALPSAQCAPLANQVRNKRFRLEPGFAQVLLDAPLYCGVGACLACVVPLSSGGVTRACVHGPVFDLARL